MDLNDVSAVDIARLQAVLTPKMTRYIPIHPTPKQTAALLLNDEQEILYGGAAGGGKSIFLLAAALQYVDTPGYSAILFRKTFSDLMLPGALIPRSQEWLAPFLQSGEVRWHDKDKKYTFIESGATLSFGYLDAKGDELRYQGAEFQFVGMDEVTHIAPEAYRYLFSRLRRLKKANVPIRMRATANPGGPHGEYYYQRFFVDKKGRFLQAGLGDNPHLDAESYAKVLDELDDVTKEQLLNGNWEIRPKGDLFDKNWLLAIHPDEMPSGIRWVRFWDQAAIDPKYRKKNTNKKDPDFTVGFKLGMCQGRYYVGDIQKFQKAPGDTEEIIRNIAIADGSSCAIRMEEEGGSSGIANTDRYARIILQGFNFAGVKPVVSKIERARPVAAACQCGNMFISTRCRNLLDFYAQLDAFPNGVNDDMIDGWSGAFSYFSAVGNIYVPPKAQTDMPYARHGTTKGYARNMNSYWHRV